MVRVINTRISYLTDGYCGLYAAGCVTVRLNRLCNRTSTATARMSGRDLRAFITSYRSQDGRGKHLAWTRGGSAAARPTEYQRLEAALEARRQESETIAQKVQKTLLAAKTSKETSLLRQHRQVWSSEHLRLRKAEEQAGSDLEAYVWLMLGSTNELQEHGSTNELQDHGLNLERERELFKMATVDPVLQLRDDLRFRLSELLQRRLPLHPSAGLQIQQQVNLVKELQEAVMGRLGAELQALEEEIAALGLEDCVACGSEVEPYPVPVEVLYADCPWPELKLSLLQSFDGLAERYQARRRSLKQRLGGTDRWCGWPAGDHLCFQWTVGQYGPDLADRRALCSDMLLRLLPHRSRQELMDHERVWDWQRFSQAQLQALARGWQRDRGELLTRALEVLEEARRHHQGELDLHREHRLQLETCARLRDTLQQWRAQQEVVSQQEAAMAARRQEKEEELLGQKRENEASMRSHQRDQLKEFYWRQQERRERLEKRDEERQAQLRRTMEEQARRDKERVRYREEALQVRRREREALELQQQREQEERQTRLEALRTQVAVVAEADPERMMGQTEAWRSRQQKDGVGLLKPLYNINTYTDSQIVSDPRVRVELALREAGLHETRYARQVLSDIQPPRPPRRDTVSANLTSGPLAL
ncbi:Coiled-coil domain-containing protein 148 [Merluccius polli]|uniref:Coiled-coil domain-containing protein 148 n=1 Tax=Merluccius polli TaxID=89951 RepID=A0AA47M797_MERPO|nr:Coiled-coil domain-containing protein 148 [Merluccius polli]